MELKIAPNTGHHFFFIPLSFATDNETVWQRALTEMTNKNQNDERLEWLQAGSDLELRSELLRLARGDSFPWMEYSEKNGHGKEWIRYRLGRQEPYNKALPALLGIWLSIESNIGDTTRGLVETNIAPTEDEQRSIDELRHPKTPYVFGKQEYANHPVGQQIRMDFRDDFREILKRIVEPKPGEEEVNLRFDDEMPSLDIVWIPAIGHDLDVDLIVDLGNTRSAVLSMFVNAKGPVANNDVFKALTFVDESEGYWDKEAEANGLADSFFVLQEPMFSGMYKSLTEYTIEEQLVEKRSWKFWKKEYTTERVIKEKKRIRPQMFVQDAVAAIGPEVEQLLSVPANIQAIVNGGSYIQSSPKRYYWDKDPIGHGGVAWWSMFPRHWNKAGFKLLQGDLLAFCPMDGSDWQSDRPPMMWDAHQRPEAIPSRAEYPRCSTMTWMAFSIMEEAYRQLNSPVFNASHLPYIRRNLHGIYLTYPSGWTKEEIDDFRAKWETARNIFYLTHLEASVSRPSVPTTEIMPIVKMEVDEAVAAQLPYVFSEIRKLETIGGVKPSILWLKMIGAESSDGDSPVARIMTLDIGGGTSDVSILEYKEMIPSMQVPTKKIKASLLFKDSESTAGDMLVKKLIEKVLLPALTNTDEKTALDLWNSKTGGKMVSTKQLLIRQVLTPIVRCWMQCVSMGRHDFRNDRGRCYSAADIRIDPNNYKDLDIIFDNGTVRPLAYANSIDVTLEQFEQCVREVFGEGGFMKRMSQIVSAFHVDAIVVCGKVSELPVLKKLIRRFIPLSGSRIVFMKDYSVGSWYPSVFSKNGKIKDPKTATVSGAALHHAFSCGVIPNWELEYDNTNFVQRNNWKIHGTQMPFLTRDAKDNSVTINTPVNTGDIFCRSIFAGSFSSEPVYKLRMKDTEKGKSGTGQLQSLTLSRWIDEGVEKLKIDDAKGVFTDAAGNQTPISADDVELYLHPMLDDENWQDSTQLG